METLHRDRAEHRAIKMMLGLARRLCPDPRDFVAEAKRQHNTLALLDGTTVDKRIVLLGSDPGKVRYRRPKKDDPVQAGQPERARTQVPDPAELLATQRPDDEALDVAIADGMSPGGFSSSGVRRYWRSPRPDRPNTAPTL
ncbi:hypothetical protein [Kribbella qitaiheensis]|uniref:hypothetical protein n=1 Tax=Kribbella qitaiheensis TaxID=1544730 RepID=UPI00162521C4|nr:hypothetical protein [Kribbella qitaiheensis]